MSNTFATAQIDSLKKAVAKAQSVEERLTLYNALSDQLWHSNMQQAIAYADSAYAISSQASNPQERLKALINKGVAEYSVGNYDSAEHFYISAIEFSINENLETNVHIYYLSLLKKQGNYTEIINVTRKLLPDEETIQAADPEYLLSSSDAFIELGNATESKKYLEPALQSSVYKEDEEMEARTHVVLAKYLVLISEYDSAAVVLNAAINTYNEIEDIFNSAIANLQLGNVLMIKGNIKDARLRYEKALTLYDSAAYEFGIAEAKRHLGNFYSSIAEYTEASKYYFEALEIFESNKNLNEIAKVYTELSWTYQSQGSYETAREYILKAIKISKEVGNKNSQSYAYNILGVILDELNEHEESLKMYDSALTLRREVGNKKGVASTLYNMGFVKEQEEEYEETLKLYLQAYDIENEIGNALGAAISEYTLGSLYTKLGQFERAREFLDRSRSKLEELNSKDNLLYNLLYTARLYERLGDFRQSTIYYKEYIDLKDELINETVSSQLAELEIKYDIKNKERAIELLDLENKTRIQELSIKEKTISNQQLIIGFIIIGSVLLVILLFVVIRLLKVKNKANADLTSLNKEIQEKNEEISAQTEELQEANMHISTLNENLESKVGKRTRELQQAYKELDTFFYRSSHDFRMPLTTFLGLAEVAKSTLQDPYALELFDKVENTALRLDKLVNKLKAISLISAETLDTKEMKFDKFISLLIDKWRIPLERKEIEFTTDVKINRAFSTYPDLLEIIFDSLIENSINYCANNKAKIHLAVYQEAGKLHIKVDDNGIGIDPVYHKLVFDMYFRANERSVGNGLGLYLVSKAVDRLNGKINLTSTPGKGTTVEISLPQD
ncbi:MAG: tetratricopeptide repeat protein [Fulvivirga sp.]